MPDILQPTLQFGTGEVVVPTPLARSSLLPGGTTYLATRTLVDGTATTLTTQVEYAGIADGNKRYLVWWPAKWLRGYPVGDVVIAEAATPAATNPATPTLPTLSVVLNTASDQYGVTPTPTSQVNGDLFRRYALTGNLINGSAATIASVGGYLTYYYEQLTWRLELRVVFTASTVGLTVTTLYCDMTDSEPSASCWAIPRDWDKRRPQHLSQLAVGSWRIYLWDNAWAETTYVPTEANLPQPPLCDSSGRLTFTAENWVGGAWYTALVAAEVAHPAEFTAGDAEAIDSLNADGRGVALLADVLFARRAGQASPPGRLIFNSSLVCPPEAATPVLSDVAAANTACIISAGPNSIVRLGWTGGPLYGHTPETELTSASRASFTRPGSMELHYDYLGDTWLWGMYAANHGVLDWARVMTWYLCQWGFNWQAASWPHGKQIVPWSEQGGVWGHWSRARSARAAWYLGGSLHCRDMWDAWELAARTAANPPQSIGSDYRESCCAMVHINDAWEATAHAAWGTMRTNIAAHLDDTAMFGMASATYSFHPWSWMNPTTLLSTWLKAGSDSGSAERYNLSLLSLAMNAYDTTSTSSYLTVIAGVTVDWAAKVGANVGSIGVYSMHVVGLWPEFEERLTTAGITSTSWATAQAVEPGHYPQRAGTSTTYIKYTGSNFAVAVQLSQLDDDPDITVTVRSPALVDNVSTGALTWATHFTTRPNRASGRSQGLRNYTATTSESGLGWIYRYCGQEAGVFARFTSLYESGLVESGVTHNSGSHRMWWRKKTTTANVVITNLDEAQASVEVRTVEATPATVTKLAYGESLTIGLTTTPKLIIVYGVWVTWVPTADVLCAVTVADLTEIVALLP